MTPLRVGRYTLQEPIGSGGMATVYAGTVSGAGGFLRQVAIKRLRDDFLGDPDAVAMLLDEARLVARIHHPHVVSTLDVLRHGGELLLVMEYVPGVSLAELIDAAAEQSVAVPRSVALRIMTEVLSALDAAHRATGDDGTPLGIVHRDVSPQNILIGPEGSARLADFGVAKAAGRVQTTRDGQLKGKLSYMAPEQICGGHVDRRTDLYAAGVVLWELLTGERLFQRDSPAATVNAISTEQPPPPSSRVVGLPPGLDAVVLAALSKNPNDRPDTAPQMAAAIAASAELAVEAETRAFVALCCPDLLRKRSKVALGHVAEPDATAELPAGMAERIAKASAAEEPTLARSATAGPPRRSKMWALPVLALAGGLVVWLALDPGAPRAESALAATPSAEGAPATRANRPPAPQSPAAASITREALGRALVGDPESPAAVPSPTAQTSSAKTSRANAAPSSKPRPIKNAARAMKAQLKADCDPPYLVDAEGAKQYKLECL